MQAPEDDKNIVKQVQTFNGVCDCQQDHETSVSFVFFSFFEYAEDEDEEMSSFGMNENPTFASLPKQVAVIPMASSSSLLAPQRSSRIFEACRCPRVCFFL